MKTQLSSVVAFLVSIALLVSLVPGEARPAVVHAQEGFSCASVTEIPQVECEALVALYNSTSGANWTKNSGWLITSTPCSWFGVTCNGNGRIRFLNLPFNQLSGPIPSELGNLTNLESLVLRNNQLSGSIPPELENLDSLQGLDLSNNQLSGPIPSELGNLTNLQALSLRRNQLSGAIPSELGSLNSLQALLLQVNQLSGPIPSELGNLNSLRVLELSSNPLTGSIPSELGNLTNLWNLSLQVNQLSGPIPSELGNLNSLQFLSLAVNQLSGPIPSELGNLTNLTLLNLRNNQLSGPIPSELGNLNNLTSLVLSNNDPSLCVSTSGLLDFLDNLTLYRGPQNLCVVVLPIDIKPGSDPNSINCNNENEIVAIAILTTEDFDATTVDHTTVAFEGASEMHVAKKTGEPRRHEEDVDYDGDLDLVFHFRLGDTSLTCESIEGTLAGETFDGRAIEGSDSVRMINPGGPPFISPVAP